MNCQILDRGPRVSFASKCRVWLRRCCGHWSAPQCDAPLNGRIWDSKRGPRPKASPDSLAFRPPVGIEVPEGGKPVSAGAGPHDVVVVGPMELEETQGRSAPVDPVSALGLRPDSKFLSCTIQRSASGGGAKLKLGKSKVQDTRYKQAPNHKHQVPNDHPSSRSAIRQSRERLEPLAT